jgi:hypothetical protein
MLHRPALKIRRSLAYFFGIFREAERLRKENAILKSELDAKGNIFYKDQRWLGIHREVHAVVVNGEIIRTNGFGHGDTL